MALPRHTVLIAVIAATLGPGCTPRNDAHPGETSLALPPPPPAPPLNLPPSGSPVYEFVDLGTATYAGGTFRGWVKRYEGRLVAAQQKWLRFHVPPDIIVGISPKNIRAAEYGPKPGRDARQVQIFESGGTEPHYLTLRYADDVGHEQVVVFDLQSKTVEPTLTFIAEHGRVNIEYQHGTSAPGR